MPDALPYTPGRRYPALTIWQPWASLIAAGAKPYEFRKHHPARAHIGHPLAIHAGKRPAQQDEIKALLHGLQTGTSKAGLVAELAVPLLERALAAPRSLPHSSIVCLAILGVPLAPETVRARFAANDSDRAEHFSWAWPMMSPRPLAPPLPAVGSQGFWTWQAPDA